MDASRPTMSPPSRAVRLAALGGVVGPILFASLVVIGGILYDGYSHTSQKISELGGEGAEYAVLQNLNFIMIVARPCSDRHLRAIELDRQWSPAV